MFRFYHISYRESALVTAFLFILVVSSFATISPIISTRVAYDSAVYAKISSSLLGVINAHSEETVNVLITTSSSDYSRVIEDVNRLGGTVTSQFRIAKGLAATIPADKVLELAENEDILKIELDVKRELASLPTFKELDEVLSNPTVLESEEYRTLTISPSQISSVAPYCYWNPQITQATEVWAEGYWGQNSLVVIIDTGIWTGHFMFAGTNIIGGIDMSDDVGDPTYEGWDNPYNHFHGSHVAGILASTGGIIVPEDDPLALAIERYTGVPLPSGDSFGFPDTKVIWLLGIAPAASLYIIKVFDHTGGGVPESMIIEAIEHAIELKESGQYDVDVISMSLGGPTLYDGRDLEDQTVDYATSIGITVVAAAGNEGPASMTVGSPGSANTAITVAAAADPVHTRVYWDYYYDWPGIGYYLYKTDDIQIYAFSSRGPTSDGRLKPIISATGISVLSAYPTGGTQYIAWASGTSMATPAVSGAVALLNDFAEGNGLPASPQDYKQALINGAIWLEGYNEYDQGAGYLNVYNSLEALKADESLGDKPPKLPKRAWLEDISNIPLVGYGTYTARIKKLPPGYKKEFIFKLTVYSGSVELEITNVHLGKENPLGMNSFEVYIHSAKRTMYDYYIDSANVFGDSYVYIDDFTTYWEGEIYPYSASSEQLEPGYMKIVIENDWTSYDDLSCRIKITVKPRESPSGLTGTFLTSGKIGEGESTDWIDIPVPEGTTKAVLKLHWIYNWAAYPTNDLDLIVVWDEGLNVDGATLNSPEMVVLENPTSIQVLISGYTVYTKWDYYILIVYFISE